MGSRANYIITENGRHELFYTHWGAQTIPRDFFFGSEVALALIRDSQPTDELLDDIWAEGGALIDFDKRCLRLWGGDDIYHDIRLRDLWVELMCDSWTGWDVHWASHGVFELADHLGIGRATVRRRTGLWDRPFDGATFPTGQRPLCLQTFVTLRRDGPELRDVAMPLPLDYGLTAGPRIVSLVEAQPPLAVPHEKDGWPEETLIIDTDNRMLWACVGTLFRPLVADIVAEQWPGWTSTSHVGGMPEHLRLTSRTPGEIRLSLEDHLKSIADTILSGNVDTARLLRNITRPDDARQMTVHPLFHEAPRLEMAERERMDYFLSVVSRWRHRHGST